MMLDENWVVQLVQGRLLKALLDVVRIVRGYIIFESRHDYELPHPV